jgi:hypothetical protein
MFVNSLGISIPEPLGMHPDAPIGRGYDLVIVHSEQRDARPGERFFLRYCHRNKCGGVYSNTFNWWTMVTPITFAEFLEMLKEQMIISAHALESPEVQGWIQACSLASAQGHDRSTQ